MPDFRVENDSDDESFRMRNNLDEEEEEEEEDDDDDEKTCGFITNEDDARLTRSVHQRGRRGTVMAVPLTHDATWTPPVYPKTIADKESIKYSLRDNFLFSSVDAAALEVIVQAMTKVSFRAHERIIEQGDPGESFYIIEEGECVVDVNGQEVGTIEGGKTDRNFFGELALMYNAPRAATVKALTYVRGWALDQVTFKQILIRTNVIERNARQNFLRQVPLLAQLSSYEHMQLADALVPKTFTRGSVILEAGDTGQEFYLIEAGQVKCTPTGSSQVWTLDEGDYFGELALLHDVTRQATVKATCDTTCLVLNRNTFKRILGPLESVLNQHAQRYVES